LAFELFYPPYEFEGMNQSNSPEEYILDWLSLVVPEDMRTPVSKIPGLMYPACQELVALLYFLGDQTQWEGMRKKFLALDGNDIQGVGKLLEELKQEVRQERLVDKLLDSEEHPNLKQVIEQRFRQPLFDADEAMVGNNLDSKVRESLKTLQPISSLTLEKINKITSSFDHFQDEIRLMLILRSYPATEIAARHEIYYVTGNNADQVHDFIDRKSYVMPWIISDVDNHKERAQGFRRNIEYTLAVLGTGRIFHERGRDFRYYTVGSYGTDEVGNSSDIDIDLDILTDKELAEEAISSWHEIGKVLFDNRLSISEVYNHRPDIEISKKDTIKLFKKQTAPWLTWLEEHKNENKEYEEHARIIREYIQKLDKEELEGNRNSAQLAKPPANEAMKAPGIHREGGIDFNPAQMSMEIKNSDTGKEGIASQETLAMTSDFSIDPAQVTGATFTIRQMTPVTNLPQILGLNSDN